MLTVATVALLVPATAAAAYYVLLTTARPRRTPAGGGGRTRFAVLVPAHDEAGGVADTVRTVRSAEYPADRVRVVVVADNCTDATADVARRAGAEVIVRTDPGRRGKGYAVAFALDRVLPDRPDAVLVLDADCELSANAFRVFDAHLAAGAEAVQAAVVTRNAGDGPAGFAVAVGNHLDNATAAGKDRLGLRVPLRGTGMCLGRAVLERVPWRAFGLTEDAEYGERLAAAGVRVRFDPAAAVRCDTPAAVGELCRQRRRWRAALSVGGLRSLVESKPLVLAELMAATAVAVAATVVDGDVWPAAWAAGIIALTAAVYLRAAVRVGLTVRRVGFLFAAPWVVARLLIVTLGGVVRQERQWERTRRGAEPAS
jgi:cellulose synthase/poly-beta-1,6-N-acetylglucosamine synthase-like glycosyltransferase